MKPAYSLALLVVSLWFPIAADSQQKKTPPPSRTPQLMRSTSRHEVRRFAYGGTLTVVGAPEGSVTIEGWSRNEIDIRAEIQLRADTENDLALLAAVNTFVLDEDTNHLRILTTGTHDKAFMRTVAKKFPKALLGLPWKVDYRIRVPVSTDLEINTGRGSLSLTGVEGNIRISATESRSDLAVWWTLSATIAIESKLSIPTRSWRGNGAEVRCSRRAHCGTAFGFQRDIDADILRSDALTMVAAPWKRARRQVFRFKPAKAPRRRRRRFSSVQSATDYLY